MCVCVCVCVCVTKGGERSDLGVLQNSNLLGQDVYLIRNGFQVSGTSTYLKMSIAK